MNGTGTDSLVPLSGTYWRVLIEQCFVARKSSRPLGHQTLRLHEVKHILHKHLQIHCILLRMRESEAATLVNQRLVYIYESVHLYVYMTHTRAIKSKYEMKVSTSGRTGRLGLAYFYRCAARYA